MQETVLFVQHGDYREAFRRFDQGGEETYLDQLKSVRFVEALSKRLQVVVAAPAEQAYDETLGPDLRAIGIPRDRFHKSKTGEDLLDACSPSRVIPRTAHLGLLRATKRAGTPCLPLFADIFQPVRGTAVGTRSGLSAWIRLARLKSLLSTKNVVGVGNHGLNAAQTLVQTLSVRSDSVLPWEWTPLKADPVKREPEEGMVRVIFAGTISEEKGAGDLVRAVRELDATLPGRLEIVMAGSGPDLEGLKSYVKTNRLDARVRFLGRTPRKDVVSLMRSSNVVVVPSRHVYPEGMPNVIFEALAARAPLVLSDHPSFVGRLVEGQAAVFFRASDSVSLAAAIQRVVSDDALSSRLSGNAEDALRRLYVGTSWYRLVDLFLEDPFDKSNWVAQHSLAALGANRMQREQDEGVQPHAHTH